MFPDLTPFVPSHVCLSCNGCCRFNEPASPWRPRATGPERTLLTAADPAAGFEAPGGGACAGLPTTPDGETHICRFFRPADHICRVYPQRPFECRLYPFVLVRRGPALEVCAHLSCPFIQDHLGQPAYEDYTAYLRRYFASPRVREALQAHPGLAGAYDGFSVELMTVFTIEESGSPFPPPCH